MGAMGSIAHRATMLAAFWLAGCATNHYRVSLAPDSASMRREVACWREENYGDGVLHKMPFPADRLEKVARAYGKTPPTSGEGTHVFAGVFSDSMPDDVGGASLVSCATTPLGSVWRYVERFRGDPDPQASLVRRFRAANQLSEFLVAWFGTELEGRPGWDRLKAFFEGPLRRDLKNLALLAALAPPVRPKDGQPTGGEATLDLFLVEHGYLRADEVARFQGDQRSVDPHLIERFVARRMGIADADPVPESLAFLREGRAEASLLAFSSSPLVQRFWKERASASTEASPIGPGNNPAQNMLVQLLFEDLLQIRLFEDRDVLEVSLACGVEPVQTDGEWRAAEGRIVWPETTLSDRGVGGRLCHATWAIPDADAQRARFGKVVLAGEALSDYVAWRANLPPAERARWDAALAALSPGANLLPALDAIRLPAEGGEDLAKEGRTILRKALVAAK